MITLGMNDKLIIVEIRLHLWISSRLLLFIVLDQMTNSFTITIILINYYIIL